MWASLREFINDLTEVKEACVDVLTLCHVVLAGTLGPCQVHKVEDTFEGRVAHEDPKNGVRPGRLVVHRCRRIPTVPFSFFQETHKAPEVGDLEFL